MDGTPDAAQKVGVEVEFHGLDTGRAAEVVARALGGSVVAKGEHRATVTGTTIGDIKIELDTRYADPDAPAKGLLDKAIDSLDAREETAKLLTRVVPVEISVMPIEPAQFPVFDRALDALRQAGAVGTGEGFLYAFGMHLNVALAHGGVPRALSVAAAYAFAERWLRRVVRTDAARRMTPFIDPYPRGYIVELAEATAGGVVPPIEEFVPLYQTYNPTRNRGLDMWPMLAHFAPAEVARLHGPVKVPRPAFHYRLPDSRLGDPGWSPWPDLDRWLLIERAADDPERFERLRASSLAVESGKGVLSDYLATLDAVMA